MTVGELLRRIDSRELVEWQAYMKIEAKEALRAQLATRLSHNLASRRRKPTRSSPV